MEHNSGLLARRHPWLPRWWIQKRGAPNKAMEQLWLHGSRIGERTEQILFQDLQFAQGLLPRRAF